MGFLIMSIIQLTAQLLKTFASGGDINYEPYDMRKVRVFYGLPPIPINGLAYITAQFKAPRTRDVDCLSGDGVIVDNSNKSGTIELGLMSGSVSAGAIQVTGYMQQPFPLIIEDESSGGTSTVVAPACRLADTPVWRREARPGIDVYTFTAPRMAIVHGMRLISE